MESNLKGIYILRCNNAAFDDASRTKHLCKLFYQEKAIKRKSMQHWTRAFLPAEYTKARDFASRRRM